ncbi:MAG: nuclear transport factor 2 family protein [Bacteroidales bacterium]|nr:nuclear transport factor 2 family protein [Bacteroidales bacterium]
MKNTLMISFTCFLSTVFFTLTKGQNLAGIENSHIERQVDSVFHTMVKAAENLDYDEISTGVDDRYGAGFIVNGSYYQDYSQMISTLKANLREGMQQRITILHQKISVISDDVVLLTASGNAEATIDTGQSFHVKFLWSFVYKKINEEWKVIQSHQSQAN